MTLSFDQGKEKEVTNFVDDEWRRAELKVMRPAGLRRLQPTCGVHVPLRHLSLRHSSVHLDHAQHNDDMEVLGQLL